MKLNVALLSVFSVCAVFSSVSFAGTVASPSARILVVTPAHAAGNETFIKAVKAVESFTRDYFASSVSVETAALPSVSADAVYAAASGKNARWALVFSVDDDDCLYRAYDCQTRSILSYENKSAYQVDLDRSGAIDLWTSKDLYALLYQHLLSANRFFLKEIGTSSDAERRLVVSVLRSDEKSSADFPSVPKTVADALGRKNGSLQALSVADCRYPADLYRFIGSSEEIKAKSREWNARWYLSGTLFEDKGSYKLYLFLLDCTGSWSAQICDTSFFTAAELDALLAQSVEKISLLLAGGRSGSDLSNPKLVMLSEYTRSGQMPVYSLCPSPQGDLYLSMMTSVLHFSPDGKLVGETGLYGNAPEEFQGVYKVRTDARGNVFLLDYAAGRVLKYGRDGSFRNEIKTGIGYPVTLAVGDDGTVAVSETGKNSLVILREPYLEPRQTSAGDLSYIAGIFFYRSTLYAWGTENAAGIRLIKINADGTSEKGVLIRMPNFFAGHLACDADGNFYALEQTSGYLLKADSTGKVLWLNRGISGMSGGFSTPNDLTVGSDGRIFIADMMHRRGLVCKEVLDFSPCADAASYLARAKAAANHTGDRYLADLHCAVSGGSAEAAGLLSDSYASRNCFDQALSLLEKRKAAGVFQAELSRKMDDLRFRSFIFSGDLLSDKIERMLKSAGIESARPLYSDAVKNYEMALKIRPEDRDLQKRYTSLKNIFERASDMQAPQIEITGISTSPVFAALYKFYNENELGTAVIRNTTGKTIDSLFARIEVKGYMDYPTESRTYRALADGSGQKVKLFAVFNNNILNLTEDTPLSAQVSVVYKIEGKEYSTSKTVSLSVYNRNALVWDDAAKLSSFVTPKDPVVSVFSRGVLNRFRNSRFSFMNQNLLSAMQIFDSLGVYGITYVKDPKTPFAVFSRKRTEVDFIQYPRDTLRFKTGDCDDLTVLTSALLENVGIETSTVTVPGHIFLIFNTGLPEASAGDISQNEHLIVRHNGMVWIPVETTLIGKPFLRAWEESADTFARYRGTADLAVNPVHEGWEKYAPVTLNETPWSPQLPDADMSEKIYFEDINSFIERELQKKALTQKERMSREPKNPSPYNSIGVVYARYGRYEEAESWFKKAIALQPDYMQSFQNLGNLCLIRNDFLRAEEYYRKAIALVPGNAYLYMHLAMLYDRMNRRKDLEKAYERAVNLDARLEKQYSYLLHRDDGSKAAAQEKPVLLWGE